MVHNLSPFLLRFEDIGINWFGPDFGIRWYGLAYMAGFVIGYLILNWLTPRQRAGLDQHNAGDFVSYVAIGILVGGRLGYCLFYSPDLFTNFKSSPPFWGVLAVNQGGMASHGGIIGVIVACWLYSRRYSVNWLYLMDLVALVGPIGIFFGRIANFINGELVGRPAEAGFSLGVKFPQDMYAWVVGQPQKLKDLAEVVDHLGIKKDQWLEWISRMNVDVNARDSIYGGLTKIIDEIQRGSVDSRVYLQKALEPFLELRHPSQLYAALGEGVILFLLLFLIWRRPRKPGIVGACFVLFYSIVRISDEMFRMPDAHIGYQWLGLTRGQILSFVMFGIGAILLFLWGRANSLSINGWGRGQTVRVGRK